jgi:hypothetical protein
VGQGFESLQARHYCNRFANEPRSVPPEFLLKPLCLTGLLLLFHTENLKQDRQKYQHQRKLDQKTGDDRYGQRLEKASHGARVSIEDPKDHRGTSVKVVFPRSRPIATGRP